MNKKRKEFLNALIDIAGYWSDKPDGSFGAILSVLAMFDGCTAHTNFRTIELKGISNDDELHDDFCKLRRERNEKV